MTTTAVDGNGGEREGRGRLKGKSPLAIVRSSGLPAALGEAVLAVTGKTRLWPWERAEVARELCGHFLDGLEAGATAEELRASFGDPRSAARLITRAKKRNRPWAWRAMKRSVQAAGVLLCLLVVWYGWNAVRFYSGSPTIKLNIQAEMNAPALATPVEQRGWPYYRDAARELNAAKFNVTVGSLEGWPVLTPGSKEWDAACAAADAVRPALEKVGRGASMARSACVISSVAPSEADAGAPNGEWADPNENPMGLGVLLPQLSVYRQHARLLCFETARAAHAGRSADATARVEQMLSLARHAGEDGTLIAQLVSVAIAHLTFDTINRTVRDYPALFTDEQLQRLAHRVSAFAPGPEGTAAWRPNLALERRAFEDVLQRFFTDDGHGDGRLCDGMMFYHSEFGVVEPKAAKFFNPVLAGVVAGRKETSSLYNKFMDRVESENAKPRYLRDVASLEREVDELKAGLGIRNSLVALMVPGIAKVASSFDVGRTLRDATAAGLSVELYWRKHGRFPASWSDLVPRMLPAAPEDPWSGRALGFKAGAGAGGRPVIYSIGADKTDNGGTIGTPWDVISAWASASVPSLGGQIGTGDWVIWPKPEPVGERPQPGPAKPIGAAPTGKVYQWGWLGSLMGGN